MARGFKAQICAKSKLWRTWIVHPKTRAASTGVPTRTEPHASYDVIDY